MYRMNGDRMNQSVNGAVAPAVAGVPEPRYSGETLRAIPAAATRELGVLIGQNFIGEPETSQAPDAMPAQVNPQEKAIWYQ